MDRQLQTLDHLFFPIRVSCFGLSAVETLRPDRLDAVKAFEHEFEINHALFEVALRDSNEEAALDFGPKFIDRRAMV